MSLILVFSVRGVLMMHPDYLLVTSQVGHEKENEASKDKSVIFRVYASKKGNLLQSSIKM